MARKMIVGYRLTALEKKSVKEKKQATHCVMTRLIAIIIAFYAAQVQTNQWQSESAWRVGALRKQLDECGS
ncbi:hypothetical protein ACVA51_17650 [Pseudomonas luteola]